MFTTFIFTFILFFSSPHRLFFFCLEPCLPPPSSLISKLIPSLYFFNQYAFWKQTYLFHRLHFEVIFIIHFFHPVCWLRNMLIWSSFSFWNHYHHYMSSSNLLCKVTSKDWEIPIRAHPRRSGERYRDFRKAIIVKMSNLRPLHHKDTIDL